MAKGQKRSNRETKKPKQPKADKKAPGASPFIAPERPAAGGAGKPPRR
jgi:hypothetical protein